MYDGLYFILSRVYRGDLYVGCMGQRASIATFMCWSDPTDTNRCHQSLSASDITRYCQSQVKQGSSEPSCSIELPHDLWTQANGF